MHFFEEKREFRDIREFKEFWEEVISHDNF
jgi:hypothetical protein